jgi:prepilin-type N-terminal cleavage/methylation domain-containing protein
MTESRRRGARGFTLIELLVVLAVVAILFGMSLTIGLRRNDTEANVKSAADELAAVFRATRTKAIEKYATYAVVFNIQNGNNTSGKQLNNHNGGHWYRVIGPWRQSVTNLTFPPFFNRYACSWDGTVILGNLFGGELAFRYHMQAVEKAWDGDRHQLPVNKVRFVALTDEDNGDFAACLPPGFWPPTYKFTNTYPRPWFGYWDPATKRLFPWGGYDHALAGQRLVGGNHPSPSGFYYEGDDGAVTGSANQVDRLLVDDTNGDRFVDGTTPTYPLWHAGQPRPLVNADWQDYMVVFQPDGTVFTDWGRARHGYGDSSQFYATYGDPATGAAQPFTHLGIGDRCNEYPINVQTTPNQALEASSFPNRSGFSWITLGGDLPGDDDHYPDAQTALQSIMPLYRVGVSPFGEVRVIKVVNSDRLHRTLDPTISGANWNVKATTDTYYQNLKLTNADGTPRGTPVTDVVTSDMLLNRQWWWAP